MLDHAGSRYGISDGQLQAWAARNGASNEILFKLITVITDQWARRYFCSPESVFTC